MQTSTPIPHEPESRAGDGGPPRDLVPAMRESLNAKLERLLRRPLIAPLAAAAAPVNDDGPALFAALSNVVRDGAPVAGWQQDPNDGTWRRAIAIDYDDLWRGREREVVETVAGTVENFVMFLTDEQKRLLEGSPREFLNLDPRPECAELLAYRTERVGGAERVVELTVDERPEGAQARHVAIVPNLIPLQRQLAALHTLEHAPSDGPLAPLRALCGLDAAEALPALAAEDAATARGLDAFQAECVAKALTSPHFSVIKGPPGSGKTTVIATLVERALARGEKVLVVSPTHVAVDNVVEKLAPRPGPADGLDPRTLPVRYAARPKKLLPAASAYWVGPKKQRRAGTLSLRLQRRLCESSALAKALYARVDDQLASHAPLTRAIAGAPAVVCGTPIGILSFEPVKLAESGAFDLLIVDEVSKMTLPEFLAVAVKARRWVLVGDPEQLPPYNDAEENGVTLDDLLPPPLELACTVGAMLDRTRPGERPSVRLVVVAADPDRAVAVIRAHVAAVGLTDAPAIGRFGLAAAPGIVVCAPAELDAARDLLTPVRGRDRTHLPAQAGSVSILVERGVSVPRPAFASGGRFVEPRMRAPALLFESAFAVYHARPWAARAGQKLAVVRFRHGLGKYLPSAAAMAALDGGAPCEAARDWLVERIAEQFAVNAVSVYDWLTGIPVEHFDVSPLAELKAVAAPLEDLRRAVRPFVGTLRRQYRMHPSLSRVPRELFYFGEALEDGRQEPGGGCRVCLVQVRGNGPAAEWNDAEAQAIVQALAQLDASEAARGEDASILLITPYRAQERRLEQAVAEARSAGGLARLNVEVCTLDRCQGREAEYVCLSLVRGRSTTFLDAPKRWNVALTRARQGLFIFGDVEAYLAEASAARRAVVEKPWFERPMMSLPARVLEAYERQIAGVAALGDERS